MRSGSPGEGEVTATCGDNRIYTIAVSSEVRRCRAEMAHSQHSSQGQHTLVCSAAFQRTHPTTIPLTPPVLYVITVSDRRGAHAMASSRGFLETFTSEKRNIQSHFMLSSQLTSRKGGNTPDCLPQVQYVSIEEGLCAFFHVMLVPARRRGLLSSRRASAQSCVDRPRRQPILRQGARTHPTPNPPSFTLTLLPARQGTCILRYSQRTLK